MDDRSAHAATAGTFQVARVAMAPLAYRVDDAAKALGVGRSFVFKMMRDGRLKARKIGAATVIPHAELERVLHEAEETDATKRARAALVTERGVSPTK